MPGLMSRFSMMVKAKFSALLNRAENPRETLDYSYERQLQSLQDVKRGVADVVTAKKRLQLQTQQLEQNLVKLDGQARQALAAAAGEANRVLTWDDVILPARTKRELRQMQLVLENPQQARALGVEPPTGLLLYGPPGTGKTTVARVLAAQAKCHFLSTSPAEVNNMWVGESEKAVARIFNEARAAAPSIVFLDEVDALIPSRAGGGHQYSDKVVNQFLHEMDGLRPNQGVFVVGASNRPDMLDPALLRGGRLSRQIEIPLPDAEARAALLRLQMRRAQVDSTVDLDLLAVQTEGFSGADLRALVNEAGLQALIRIADEGGTRAVTGEDFRIGIENMRRGA
jgi:transitional endoplasmic reticulum ATPase